LFAGGCGAGAAEAFDMSICFVMGLDNVYVEFLEGVWNMLAYHNTSEGNCSFIMTKKSNSSFIYGGSGNVNERQNLAPVIHMDHYRLTITPMHYKISKRGISNRRLHHEDLVQ
jgi:hypothetical protein